MAGDHPDPPEAANIKGFAKYYNSVTEKGRASAARITLGGMALLFLYFKLKPSSKPAAAQ
ncbi:ATP synthase membrane subunit DAPIT, mitochondrial-like [Thrips palmi]|uniref:ATP synthase membrane subunit DAPIT, mitochondrial-like n=1 Tax=Thrips palmi TaxID=161013 RepID=A0A6P8ZDG2_THRPL|nr:ATP synthase membrane subunit DAPIT, mitochondrial-like [Thrips palmi]XP_034247507.1 ATP synthase membrane subunit DAPIT, mitochondrial-like [Thrips palmi]